MLLLARENKLGHSVGRVAEPFANHDLFVQRLPICLALI